MHVSDGSLTLRVSRPLEFTFIGDDGSEWLLEIEIEADPAPGFGGKDHIPLSIKPVYTEPEWNSDPFERGRYGFTGPQFLGLDMRVHTRRYRVSKVPSNADLWR